MPAAHAMAFLLVLLAVGRSPAGAQGIATAPSDERFVAGEAMTLHVPLDTVAFLNGGYAIDSAGYVELPVVGRFQVAGRSREDVEAFLGQRLSNYLRDTHVQAKPAIRLTLLGHWTRQGQYYVSPKATVWEAVYQAGGIGGEQNLDKLTVMRGETELDMGLLDSYSQGKTLAAAGIRSGDIFVIPVPRDRTGAWYWFRESLAVTAQIAGIAASALSVYITYLLIEERDERDNRALAPVN